ncbi:hypothetical protein [Kitasatospora sp. NPDC058397]|uniref:hypothetical protein n=1 Tax=unclassified Kitasatospora TaxID=2633591 RepID=UPI0036628AED
MRVILTRDSVHPGDDPPHHWDFTVDPATTLGDLIDQAANYPYRVDGSNWSIALTGTPAGEAPIATVSMHWAKPRFTNEADRQLRLDSVGTTPGELRLYFRWHPGTIPEAERSYSGPVSLFPFSLVDRLAEATLEFCRRWRRLPGKG